MRSSRPTRRPDSRPSVRPAFPAFATLPALLAAFALAAAPASADYAFGIRRLEGPAFSDAGKPLRFPFFGGQYGTLHQLVDIDGDGDLDLFLQLEIGRMLYFENAGDASSPDFRWNKDLGNSLALGAWFFFLDVDKDGDYDMVGSPDGNTLSVRLNEGGDGTLRFGPARGPLKAAGGANLSVSVLEDMNFADVDCDGDEDLFAATTLGTLRFYENTGTVSDGLPVFKAGVDGYRGFDYSKPLTGKRAAPARLAKTQHGSLNTSTWVDLDADGDLDLVYGDFYDSGMTVAVNSGTCKEPRYDHPVPLAAPGVISTPGGNLARFGDLDGDGSLDLVVSNLQGARSIVLGQRNELYFYRNRAKAPRWDFEKVAEAPFTGVDVGAYSTAQFADVDGDGDQDLFLTNKIDTGGIPRSGLFFYRNTGSPELAAYERQDQDFLRLNGDYNVSLAFGDLDDDGDPDLLAGNFAGTLCRYENAGTAKAPDFRLADSLYMDIDVGQKSAPTLADLDGDGDLDLLVGEARGILKYYRNAGTAARPEYSLTENKFQDIEGPVAASPALADVDGDGDLDLLIGGEALSAQLWINAGSAGDPRFPSAIEVESPLNFTPVFADFDGDGDPDLFGGSFAGGLVLYEHDGTVPFAISGTVRPRSGSARKASAVPFARAGADLRGWRVLIPGRGDFDLRGARRNGSAR